MHENLWVVDRISKSYAVRNMDSCGPVGCEQNICLASGCLHVAERCGPVDRISILYVVKSVDLWAVNRMPIFISIFPHPPLGAPGGD